MKKILLTIAAVALGLGRTVVDGGKCIIFCPRYPRNLLQFYPLPTDPSQPVGSTNYVGNLPQNARDDTHLARVDHSISDKDRALIFEGNAKKLLKI